MWSGLYFKYLLAVFFETFPSTYFTFQPLVAPDNQHRFETCALGRT
jgi:hypothetical protein